MVGLAGVTLMDDSAYGTTVKVTPLLATVSTVTITFPVVAPDGTWATIWMALQLVGVAVVPLKVTELEPCVLPKPVPVIVTGSPTAPDVDERLVIAGGGRTSNETALLDSREVLTLTGTT